MWSVLRIFLSERGEADFASDYNIVSEELVQYNRKFHRRWLDVWTAGLHASRVGGNGYLH
jgi:hypothetical protein